MATGLKHPIYLSHKVHWIVRKMLKKFATNNGLKGAIRIWIDVSLRIE